MKSNRKYWVAVALLAVLVVIFGLAGTTATVSKPISPQSSSPSDEAAHFQNPPSYDSGWVEITDKCGERFALYHGLNTTEVVVDITGKQNLELSGGGAVWGRVWGGVGDEDAYSVIQTSDGGYALVGFTESYGAGSADFWLVKTDSEGNLLINQTYGGAEWEQAYSLVQTSDGGYAIAGHTKSYGVGTPFTSNFWLVKTDALGNMQWSQTYGGLYMQRAFSMVQTADGGFAIAGETDEPPGGDYDFWLVKTDSAGNEQWNQTYGSEAIHEREPSLVETADGGFAIAGNMRSIATEAQDSWIVKTDSSGNHQWNRTYGGAEYEYTDSMIQTFDGGFVIAGQTNSSGAGMYDAWLVKTDMIGNEIWNKTYGTTSEDTAMSIVQTFDGGFAFSGRTKSRVFPLHTDIWLVKTDSAGNEQWNQTYAGTQDAFDYGRSVIQTVDGDYVVAGFINGYPGIADLWLIKVKGGMNVKHQMNLDGTTLISGWSQTHGGTSSDFGRSLVQTFDGGYALGGYTLSYGAGGYDFWLVKTDAVGDMQWNRTYGGGGHDYVESVIQTFDGGFAIAGDTKSYGVGTPTYSNFWLVKTDALGNVQWSQTYGGGTTDEAFSVVQTSDGGYAVAGTTNSYGAGGHDFWLVRTDPNGNALWNQTYGGASTDFGRSIVQTADGGYAMAGYTVSLGAGGYDFWLVKTDVVGNMLWNQTYGGGSHDYGESLVQTFDGGYALGGYTLSYGAGGRDYWLVKADSTGNAQWNQTYGGTEEEYGGTVIQTRDGGYALAGRTQSYGAGYYDFWAVKTDSAGCVQWTRTYGGLGNDYGHSVIQTVDGGYAIVGYTLSYGGTDLWLIKTDVEMGLAWTDLTNSTITLYRGKTDPYWNYVRVRIWTIQEPTWMFGDINQDGVVDAQDLAIVGRNYGSTFSLLSLTGIIAIAGIHTYKRRTQPE